LLDHGITYDKIVLPKLELSQPLFAFFYNQDMQLNEMWLESIRRSFLSLDKKLVVYQNVTNIQSSKPIFSELYVTFYNTNGNLQYQNTINLLQFISMASLSSLFWKALFLLAWIIVLFLFSVFVGLFIRYTLFFVYSIFLLAYDRCMSEGWGWTHLYLAILWNRFKDNKASTLKFLVFYVLATLGSYGLFAFGSYCIIKKILYSFVALPIESYTDFFFKTIFFI
jgi:hypothetical protein